MYEDDAKKTIGPLTECVVWYLTRFKTSGYKEMFRLSYYVMKFNK